MTQNGTVLATTAYITTPVNNTYDNGGSVTHNAACPSRQTVVLTRVTPLTQASKFADNMPVPMKSFENGLDKLTEINQEQAASLLQFGNSLQNAKCTGTSALQSVIGPTCIPVGTGTGPGSSFQLPVTTYLAVGDGQLVTDGAMSSGSHTLTSASAQFTPSSCGPTKVISVQYAGGTGGSNQPLVTTCTYVNATTLTLARAAATQPVSAAGVIWGTDNYTAFAQWAAALPGNAGIVPSGNFLINTAQSTRTINLGSNESITFNRNGNIYYVGDMVGSGFGSLFSVPSGTTNLQIDSPHIIGEWQNTSLFNGVRQGFGDGDAIQFIASSTISHVQIINGLFSNLFGIGVKDLNSLDTDIAVTGNTFQNNADTAINVNSQHSNISSNRIFGPGPGIETSSALTTVNNNILNGVGGQYAMALGGDTSGTPYVGTIACGNVINNPTSSNGVISIGDGFTYGTVCNNTLNGLAATSNQYGIVNVYSGFTVTGHNTISGNVINGPSNGGNCIYIAQANNDTLTGNTTNCGGNGLLTSGVTGLVGRGNIWNGAVGRDVSLGFSSEASLVDRLVNGTYTLARRRGASTFDSDTLLTNTAGVIYAGPPPSIFASTVQAPGFLTAFNASSGNPINTPFQSTTGSAGGYNIMRICNVLGANNCVIDFGPINAGTLNNSHSWLGAEYNTDFSSNLAAFVAQLGNTGLTPLQALRALTLSADPGNTFVYGALGGSLCVGSTCDGPLVTSKGDGNILYKASLIGPSTAPSGSCSRVGWSLNGDGTATYCNGSTWSQPFASSGGVTQINATPGAYTFAFSAGAGSCTGTTCTFTGTSTGGGTVTNAIAGTIPSWLALSIATSTTTPTFNFTATSQAQNLSWLRRMEALECSLPGPSLLQMYRR